MGLVKTRRLAAMHKQQCAILLCQGYGGLKAGMKLAAKKGGALPPHLYKSGGRAVADLSRKFALRTKISTLVGKPV